MGRAITKGVFSSAFIASFVIVLALTTQMGSVASAATTFEEVLVPDYGLTLQPGDSYQQEEPYTALNGSDGNMWYLLHSWNGAVKAWLVRYNADTGQHTRYQLLTGNGVPNTYLLKGSDGNLWYTGRGSYLVKIEINSQGEPVLTSYPSPGGAQKSAIVVGPNGNFWFQSAIGWFYEVSTTGQTLRQCWTNTTNTQGGMAFDAAGNLWFGNRQNNTIGFLNVNNPDSCDYTQYSDANINNPASVTLGPDGNMWFISRNNSRIGKITPSGVVTTYLASTPRDLVLGPDNNLWLLNASSVSTINTTNGITTTQSTGLGMIVNSTSTIDKGCRQDLYITYKKNPKIPTYIKDTYAIGRIDLGLYTPPTTSIINVSDNNVSPGTTIQVTAQSSDDTSVTKLELYVDNILVSSVSNPASNHTFNLDTSAYSQGNHTVTTRVYDNPDNCPVVSDPETVFIDNTNPSVSITEPLVDIVTNGSNVTFKTASSDNNLVALLELYAGTTRITSVVNPSAVNDFVWNSGSLVEGTYTLKAIAYDQSDNSTEYISPYTIEIDKTKPTVAITSPSSGATVTGATTVSASTSDANGVAGVQFKLNGSLYGTEDTVAPYSFSWDTASFVDGTYSISAVARDVAGNTRESSAISVTVANTVVLADVTICHFPGRQNQQTLTVAASAVDGHLGHGDYRGRCLPAATANNATNSFSTLDTIEELEEISVVRQTDNTVLATIDKESDLSAVNLELRDEETLQVDGLLGAVEVKKGATIKGNGKVKSLVVDEGAYLAPGSSPGCLTTEGLLLEGTYTFELGGLAACSEHDQVIVNGTVTLRGLLEIELENGYKPEVDQSFIIISNDGTDAVTNTFTGIDEGGLTEVAGITYSVSYVGGDGNDVELTVTAIDESIAAEAEAIAPESTEEGSNGGMYVVTGVIIAIIVVVIIMQVIKPSKG